MVDLLLKSICQKENKMANGDVWGRVTKNITKEGRLSKPRGLAHKLACLSYEHYNGEHNEIDFLVTIIMSGARERDYDYFYNKNHDYSFITHCELLGLNYRLVRRIVVGIWDHLDGNKKINTKCLG